MNLERQALQELLDRLDAAEPCERHARDFLAVCVYCRREVACAKCRRWCQCVNDE